MLNDVNALADGKKGRGTYVEIEKKHAMDASERELFSNKKQLVQYVSDKLISTDACMNISNTNSINASSLEHGKEKGKVILMGDNFEKGKNLVNHYKDICVGSKKKVQNTFPTHVKSLLSSGLLDGVPVKYRSMSLEKKKCLSASEFERNADCKSGHANSHIYFDSGKTIHVVVQKLKKTTPEMLFQRQNHCDLLIDLVLTVKEGAAQ
ncbi:hypothetical protein KY290_021152 [Solanum tuberosum]|uniref:Uncharacterized protein n=1 Tax=Solanum tuberosum TaxID=4113 RepID=A0ABQ7V2A4_SOLTU|nr:hypothetical protein KY289_020332 [Solanum tuberosum]KAH0692987.1 hypothetical protein KY285_020084 [Solanum tuberosum]KAH0757659.1 hypothetical protein KY290_021152 [Solanum tuberosum]